MKKISIISLILIMLVTMCACGQGQKNDGESDTEASVDSSLGTNSNVGGEFGSFTMEKADSYDQKYYATTEKNGDMIKVTVFSASGDEVFSFEPCRASDFWGICWENDSYNIWIQSADIGTICYSMTDEKWTLDSNAVKPDYIKSKYDD